MRCCRRLVMLMAAAGMAVAGCGPRSLGDFKVTYYWIADERSYPGPRTEEIPGLPGRYTAGFRKALEIEGTGRLERGEVVNDAGGGVYSIIKARWGLGCQGQPLVPYRSVATDPGVIPTGSVVLIPAFRDAGRPDGTKHDGIFWADDVGKGIRGEHIDIFVGEKTNARAFRAGAGRSKSGGSFPSSESVEVYLLNGRQAPPGDSAERAR